MDRLGVARAAPALLTMAAYAGTLAAARVLGARQVPVTVASARLFAPALWSRSVARRATAPAMDDPRRLLEWLLAFGAREPGMVLHPTCDDMAWLVAVHADALSRVFKIYTAPADALRTVLDKRALYTTAAGFGLPAPPTWFPESEAEVGRIAAEHDALVVKPRSQVFFPARAKGALTGSADEAVEAFRELRKTPHAPDAVADMPGIDLPLLQRYERGALEGVYSLSGFIGQDGTPLVARGSLKVLQRPSRVGVGLCFEAAPVDEDLLQKLVLLCRSINFKGVFEAEFVRAGGEWFFLDFNPRYFGQMEFDIARGAPLPWMFHLAALGLEDAARESPSKEPALGSPRAYHDAVTLRFMLATRRVAGALHDGEFERWHAWLDARKAESVDALLAKHDPLPGVAGLCGAVWSAVRHPRGFWRSLRSAP